VRGDSQSLHQQVRISPVADPPVLGMWSEARKEYALVTYNHQCKMTCHRGLKFLALAFEIVRRMFEAKGRCAVPMTESDKRPDSNFVVRSMCEGDITFITKGGRCNFMGIKRMYAFACRIVITSRPIVECTRALVAHT
jgi:hypothetical protein